jgi:hypothetical protein
MQITLILFNHFIIKLIKQGILLFKILIYQKVIMVILKINLLNYRHLQIKII